MGIMGLFRQPFGQPKHGTTVVCIVPAGAAKVTDESSQDFSSDGPRGWWGQNGANYTESVSTLFRAGWFCMNVEEDYRRLRTRRGIMKVHAASVSGSGVIVTVTSFQ